MITGFRSMLQARVDENYEVIKRIISSVPELISSSFAEVEKEAEEIALQNCEFDREVYHTIFNNIYGQNRPEDEQWMILEFYRSMVMLICSFAETTIRGLLKNPDERFRSNYLCKAYSKVRCENSLPLRELASIGTVTRVSSKKEMKLPINAGMYMFQRRNYSMLLMGPIHSSVLLQMHWKTSDCGNPHITIDNHWRRKCYSGGYSNALAV